MPEIKKNLNLVSLAMDLMKTNEEESNKLNNLIKHVPGIVTFSDHKRKLPWTDKYTAVLLFADISGFTALCETCSVDQTDGIDHLTRILNSYLGQLIHEIINSGGDVLKFAGDAILCIWRVNIRSDLPSTVETVVKCCQRIQQKCGEWQTDVGVKLTVKLGVSAGDMSITFLGNEDSRFYVELGPAVADVNTAEGYCKSGYIVLSPLAWSMCQVTNFDHEMMSDGLHVRIKNTDGESSNRPTTSKGRGLFVSEEINDILTPVETATHKTATKMKNKNDTKPKNITVKESKLDKLREVVKTVKALNLEKQLRLFVPQPVLTKLDDYEPMEYLSEMREVSVVFMNLILEEEDEGDSTQLLQDVFDIIYMETKALGGCLNKIFLFDKGCTFLVLFGLPGYKHERDSARSLQCSMKMKKILDTMPGVSRVSIGVTTGSTFCGVVGHERRLEYTVIGRKVNMAARLMMHYPDKVTCDDDTFTLSRLPASNFDVMVTKRMKGLRHVGTIREFYFHEDEETGLENTLPYFEFPILGREKETRLFLQELHKLQHVEEDDVDEDDVCKGRHHLVFVGGAGIGKTRLLDSFTVVAARENIRCVSFDLTTNDVNKTHFLARHILKVLLVTSGFSYDVDTEPLLMKNIQDNNLQGYLHSFSDVIGVKLKSKNGEISLNNEREVLTKRCQIYKILIQSCLDKLGPTVFILDDIKNCDVTSWDYLSEISQCSMALIVLGVRPKTIDKPPCPSAQVFFESDYTLMKDIESIDVRLMTAVACQIMDVTRIHTSLDSLIRKTSYGIPSWAEQFLLHLYERKQLMIVVDDGKGSVTQATVTPEVSLIDKKPSKERRSSSVDRRKYSLFFDISLQTSNAETGSEFTGEMLASLGYIHTRRGTGGRASLSLSSRRVAVLADGVDVKDLTTPFFLSNMVSARLDTMRAIDQLIVKCCAVIGSPLSREIIKAVLPKTNKYKISIALRRLFLNGTFECATVSLMKNKKKMDDILKSQNPCFCMRIPTEKTGTDGNVCDNFRFKNRILQETAYNILMVTQRTELHLKVAEFLLDKVAGNRKFLPHHLFSSDLPLPSEEPDVVKGQKEELNPVDVYNDIQNSSNLLSYIHHFNPQPEVTRQKALSDLISVYIRVQRHLLAAGEHRRYLDLMIEAAAVAIELNRCAETLDFLNSALLAHKKVRDVKSGVEEEYKIHTEACIERLRGKAMFVLGRMEEAYLHLRRAGNLLGLYQPTSKIQIKLLKIKLKFSSVPCSLLSESSSNYSNIKTVDRHLVEVGNCLSDLCRLHKEENNLSLLQLDACRLATIYHQRHPHPRQVVDAYSHIIDYCRTRGLVVESHRLELELFATCVCLAKFLNHDDIRVLAVTFHLGAAYCLDNGEVSKAISTGSASASLANRIVDHQLGLKILPVLALAYILSNKKVEAKSVLLELKELSGNHESRCGRAWYFILAMEYMLLIDDGIEPFSRCLLYNSVYLRDYDVVQEENIPRYYAAMNIATWYCRHGDWKNGQRWFDYWENYQGNQTSLPALLARLRKIECMLLSLWKAVEANISISIDRMTGYLEKEFYSMKSALNKTPGILPRYNILLAYFHQLKRQTDKGEKYVIVAMETARNQGNKIDLNWAVDCWEYWFAPPSNPVVMFVPSNWTPWIDAEHFDWTNSSKGRKHVMYCFPLPEV